MGFGEKLPAWHTLDLEKINKVKPSWMQSSMVDH